MKKNILKNIPVIITIFSMIAGLAGFPFSPANAAAESKTFYFLNQPAQLASSHLLSETAPITGNSQVTSISSTDLPGFRHFHPGLTNALHFSPNTEPAHTPPVDSASWISDTPLTGTFEAGSWQFVVHKFDDTGGEFSKPHFNVYSSPSNTDISNAIFLFDIEGPDWWNNAIEQISFTASAGLFTFENEYLVIQLYDHCIADCKAGKTLGIFEDGNTAVTQTKIVTPFFTPVDTTAPVLTLPSIITAEATSAEGAIVEYTATANDDVDGPITPTCSPISGSTFPIGTTSVSCSATDASGKITTGIFNVTVQDTTPPVISIIGANPANIEQSAIYEDAGATAADIVDGTVIVTPTGAVDTGIEGTYTITYSATDAANNAATTTRTVNVAAAPANQPPAITSIPSQTIEVNNPLTFTVVASDPENDTLTYSLGTGAPVNAAINEVGVFNWTPTAEGTFTFDILVSDGTNTPVSALVTITVVAVSQPATLASIAITTPANKLAYNIGEALDIAGLVVTGTYDDGATQPETITVGNISGFDSSLANPSQTLTVTVGGFTATYTVSINEAAGGGGGVDTTPPVISIIGDNPASVLVGAVYTDAGATAADNIDQTVNVVAVGLPINTAVVGTFTITYTATDAALNTAITTRTVNVINPPAQLCVPFTVFGQITDAATPSDGATVVLTNNVTQDQLQTVSEQGGFYLIETANLNTCLAIGDSVTIQASFNNLSGSQSFVHSGGALREINIVIAGVPANQPPTVNLISSQTIEVNNLLTFAVIAEDADAADVLTYSLGTGAPVGAEINAATGVFSWMPTVAETLVFDVLVSDGINPVVSSPITITVTVAPQSEIIVSRIEINPANIAMAVGATSTLGVKVFDQNDIQILPEPAINWSSSNDLVATIGSQDIIIAHAAGAAVITATIGNISASVNVTVNELVPTDTTAPIITIIGANPADINIGDNYADAGATANDETDGDITANIQIVNNVNTSIAGTYSVAYTVSDQSGNFASVIRTVSVNVVVPAQDITSPVITILGANPMSINAGTVFIDSGVTALDDVDGNITANITSTSTVNAAVAGTYAVVYTVSDASGNVASSTRTVNVTVPAPAASPIPELIATGGGGGGGGFFIPTPTSAVPATPALPEIAAVIPVIPAIPAGQVLGATTFNFSRNMGKGSSGNDVRELQLELKAEGVFEAEATGFFGSLTEQAVIKFQAKKNISQTGFVGPLTRGELNKSGISGVSAGQSMAAGGAQNPEVRALIANLQAQLVSLMQQLLQALQARAAGASSN